MEGEDALRKEIEMQQAANQVSSAILFDLLMTVIV
jgi:hypothetical protein